MANWPIPNPSLERIRARNPWAPNYAASASEAQSLATLWVMLFFVGGLMGIGLAGVGHAAGPQWRAVTTIGAALPLLFGFGTLIEATRYSFLSCRVWLRRHKAAKHRSLPSEHTHWPYASSDASLVLQVALTTLVVVSLSHVGSG
jgi:hypothetical protein